MAKNTKWLYEERRNRFEEALENFSKKDFTKPPLEPTQSETDDAASKPPWLKFSERTLEVCLEQEREAKRLYEH